MNREIQHQVVGLRSPASVYISAMYTLHSSVCCKVTQPCVCLY